MRKGKEIKAKAQTENKPQDADAALDAIEQAAAEKLEKQDKADNSKPEQDTPEKKPPADGPQPTLPAGLQSDPAPPPPG